MGGLAADFAETNFVDAVGLLHPLDRAKNVACHRIAACPPFSLRSAIFARCVPPMLSYGLEEYQSPTRRHGRTAPRRGGDRGARLRHDVPSAARAKGRLGEVECVLPLLGRDAVYH
eukprot:2616973-Prymnesium_polylepis.3